jgi:hypothetical protein
VCDYLKVPSLTATEYFINEYLTVMQPIEIGLDILQGEKDVTSGNLLSSIVVIRNSLNNLKNRDENSTHPSLNILIPLVDALLEGLQKRFDIFFRQEHFQLAAALHPKFKLNWLGTSEKDTRLKKQIISKIEINLRYLDVSDSTKPTPPPKVQYVCPFSSII